MAAHDEDAANVFAVPDFWRTSTWLDQLPQDNATSFFSGNLKDFSTPFETHFFDAEPVKTQQDGFFKLPPMEAPSGGESIAQETSDKTQTTEDPMERSDLESDIWAGLDEPTKEGPALQTWESFIKGTASSSQAQFLTEAGSAAYDAFLAWKSDPLGFANMDVPVVEAKAYYSSLLALALGRESVFFFRDDSGRTFKPALRKMRIPGHSLDVLRGLEKQCLACGSRFLELRDFVQRTYSKDASRCGVAFTSALDEMLQAVDQTTVAHGANPRSLLQLQAITRGISAVLTPFHRLASRLLPNTPDQEIISLVFDQASSLENSEAWLRDIMQEVLRRVSKPWTEFLEEWIGTKREEGIAFLKSDVGSSKGFVKVEAEAFTDDMGIEVQDVDYRLDSSKMPHFMPDDVSKTTFETGRNLRFIRTSHPDHPLAQPDVVATSRPPQADWHYEWDTILQLERQVGEYRERLLETIQRCHGSATHDGNGIAASSEPQAQPSLGFFTLDEHRMEERLLESMNQLSAPVLATREEGSLARIIRHHLGSGPQPHKPQPQTQPHWSLLPVLSFAGIVAAQAQVVNRETLRLLFRSHDLRSHLKMQRDFQLFGNGLFCSSLSHALFDPELERADRQAGVAFQGGTMGLRLGGRETWPPASSELRLALMGVLTESYHNQRSNATVRHNFRDSSGLPGDLSFALRDLSEEEIEKCLNPDSLEALDFLRLGYKAPTELSFILTPLILMQYDRIFKLLLRVLRMDYLTTQLWRDAMRQAGDDPVTYRFVREARHFVSSIGSYFLDTGVALPWQAFEDKLDKIQASLDDHTTEKLESPEQLREFHTSVLNAIMLALFLRKRQQPVLKLLEEVFTIILDYAKAIRVGDAEVAVDVSAETSQLYSRFKKKVQVFITVCRGLTEKSRSSSKKDEKKGFGIDGIGDESIVSQLLMKLDINDFYSKH